MSSGCGRQFCSKCEEELIHRDHRKIYESSSALGQIIWREGPRDLTASDLDILALKILNNNFHLLRLIEQKNPTHKFETPQMRALKLLDAMIMHCRICPKAEDLAVDPRSGVYIIRGLIEAANKGKRKTILKGKQIIHRLSDGSEYEFENHETLFRFLDPESKARRSKK